MNQEERRLTDPDTAMKIDEFIEKLERMCEGKDMPYHFIIDDPSGNSFIQNPHAPANDVYATSKFYNRTNKDMREMGFMADDEDENEENKEEEKAEDVHKEVKKPEFTPEEVEHMIKLAKMREGEHKEEEKDRDYTSAGFDYTKSIDDQSKDIGNINNEVLGFPMVCYQCGAAGLQNACTSNIPHFKEIIILAFSCEECGFRSVEVKQGGATPDKGKKITLTVKGIEDLKRDLYKGDDCEVRIPEVDLSLAPGSLGGIYTTVEGLISKIHDKLEEANPFGAGDSSMDEKFRKFLSQLQTLNEGDTEFTVILDDPMGNCYIYSPLHPDSDPQIVEEEYERTYEQNDYLGINDMKVD